MKKICFVMFLAFVVSACGNDSKSGGKPGPNPPNKPGAAKHIEPGTDLTFTCIDTFNETTVTLHSKWNSTNTIWAITAEEFNSRGQKINELKNLIGKPVQEWQMDIKNGSVHFGKMAQDGADQAMFYGASRNMECTFK